MGAQGVSRTFMLLLRCHFSRAFRRMWNTKNMCWLAARRDLAWSFTAPGLQASPPFSPKYRHCSFSPSIADKAHGHPGDLSQSFLSPPGHAPELRGCRGSCLRNGLAKGCPGTELLGKAEPTRSHPDLTQRGEGLGRRSAQDGSG